MNSFKSPLTPQITNPVGIDRPIQELQNTIAALGWIEKSFARAYTSYRHDIPTNKLIIYPEVWQGRTGSGNHDADMLNVMPNDNLKSQSFIKVDDPTSTVERVSNGKSRMGVTIQIIIWFDIRQIDKTVPYRFTEVLKAQAQAAIANCQLTKESSVSILRIYEEADNVFRGYTIDKVKNQELVHPFGGFRFECSLLYVEDCPTPEIPS